MILAGTELPLILRDASCSIPFLDTPQIHVKAALDRRTALFRKTERQSSSLLDRFFKLALSISDMSSLTHDPRTTFAVFGAGGVGGYFGAVLARAGYSVAFIARGAHLEAIRRSGLHIRSPEGDFNVTPAQVTDYPADVGPVDVVLLGVKAWQLPEAETPSPSKMGKRRSSGVRRVKVSVSLRGVAWQKSTSPRPGISTWHVGGQPSNNG